MDDDGPSRPTVDAKARGSGGRTRVAADTDPVPLQTLSDVGPRRYWTGAEIARGGMGRVVEATDSLLGRSVALKEALDTDPEARRRFVRETRITARLEHPSIVPVYDAGTTPDGTPFYVMRKVTGRPLDELVLAATDLRGRLALLPHVVAATQALAHAHERGVIHRDVKPANILVGNLGETVVIDWGLAKVIDEVEDEPTAAPVAPLAGDSLHTRYGTVFGTPGFMSPEQLGSSNVDARSDVYALGATLYYVLARTPPHAAPSGDAMMDAAAKGPPAPLRNLVPGVPAELATIVDKALAFDDRDRYPHAGALAEDLTRFATGQLVASHHYSALERIQRFVRRYRVAVIAVGAALIALAAGAVVAVGRVVDARDEALSQARAAEAARHRETDRADDLVLSQARLILDHNPAAAIALVRPLADGPRWREVHAIAAGAQAAGPAWRLPGTGHAIAIAMAPDGAHGAALDEAGQLRLFDLVTRTARELANVHTTLGGVEFVDNTHLVTWDRHTASLQLVDVATGTGREVTLEAPATTLFAHRGVLLWIDEAARGWRLEPGGAPTRLPVDDQIGGLAPSPDGTRIAVCARHGLYLISAGPPERLATTPTFTATWAADGQRLLVVADSEILDLNLAAKTTDHLPGEGRVSVAIVRGVVYSNGLSGVMVGGRLLPMTEMATFGLVPVGDDTLVTGVSSGQLVVVAGTQRLDLQTPIHDVIAVAGAPGSRRILALGSGAVYLWDLDASLPRTTPIGPGGQSYGRVGAHTVYVTTDKVGQWLDLATGETKPAPALGLVLRVLPSPDGDHAILVVGGSHAVLVTRGSTETRPLGDGIAAGAYVGADRFVAGGADGVVAVHDLVHGGPPRTLATLPREVAFVRVAGSWIVAKSVDGGFARANLDSTAPATVLRPEGLAGSPVIISDGRVLFGAHKTLSWWNLDGSVTPYVTMPNPIDSTFPVDATRAVVRDAEGLGYYVDLHAPAYTALDTMPYPALGRSAAAQLLNVPQTTGTRLVDLQSGASWLAARSWARAAGLQLSDDGEYMFDVGDNALARWTVPVPVSPAATARWLDTLTNARWDPAAHAVTW